MIDCPYCFLAHVTKEELDEHIVRPIRSRGDPSEADNRSRKWPGFGTRFGHSGSIGRRTMRTTMGAETRPGANPEPIEARRIPGDGPGRFRGASRLPAGPRGIISGSGGAAPAHSYSPLIHHRTTATR
jgi:hypothetical protein